MNGLGLAEVADQLERRLNRPVRRDARLGEFSTYRLGGPAAVLAEPETVVELEAVRSVLPHGCPLLVVGRGSNLLVSDAGFPGLVLHLTGDFEAIEISGDAGVVRAGAGVALPVLARQAAAAGWSGLEFFVGIPGSVGGAVRMNAGGHGRETRDVLREAGILDLASAEPEVRRAAEGFDFSYRHSNLSPLEVVTGATFEVSPDDSKACEARLDEIVRWRREHQPGGSNAGSVFTNPPGDSAGRIIDACGLKGFRVGGAVVSEKHANFFQAEPGATTGHVHRLVLEVQRIVEEQTGVRLVPELTMVGFVESQ